MDANDKNQDSFVESVIDSMIAGDTDSKTAVSQILRGGQELPDVVDMDVSEGATPSCVNCDSEQLVHTVVEGVDALVCTECGTGYIPKDAVVESEDEDGEEDGELYEAEFDEDDPICPVCESEDLDGKIIEDEGEEFCVINCNGCGNKFVGQPDADEEGEDS